MFIHDVLISCVIFVLQQRTTLSILEMRSTLQGLQALEGINILKVRTTIARFNKIDLPPEMFLVVR